MWEKWNHPNFHRKHGAFSNILVIPLEFLLWHQLSPLPTAELLLSIAPYLQWYLMLQTEPALLHFFLLISPLRTGHYPYSSDSYNLVLMTDIVSRSTCFPCFQCLPVPFHTGHYQHVDQKWGSTINPQPSPLTKSNFTAWSDHKFLTGQGMVGSHTSSLYKGFSFL